MNKPTLPKFPTAPSPEEAMPPAAGWRRIFASLKVPNYRYFYMGQFISMIGTWVRMAALGWIAYQMSGSEFILGLVATLNALPMVLFSVWAGSLADRIPKLRMFTATSWVAMLSSLLLSYFLFQGQASVSYLLVFSLFWGLATAFEVPSRQAMIVELVGAKDLTNAIALNSAMVNATRILGPAVAGVLIARLGAAWCFLLDGLSYLAVLYAIHNIRITLPPVKFRQKGWDHLLEGIRYVRRNPSVFRTLSLLLVMSTCAWPYISQLPAVAKAQLGMNAEGYGWLAAINGLGACAAALTVAALGDRPFKDRQVFWGILLFGTAILLFGLQHHPLGAAFFLFFCGYGVILFFSTSNSLIQSETPNELRGRVMGLWALGFGGGAPFGSFLIGLLADHVGANHALQAGGAISLLLSWLVFRRFRTDYKR
ncbi:MAG TPA: MFS transporter [bacterium]|nr:MFS transporter [bacterium]